MPSARPVDICALSEAQMNADDIYKNDNQNNNEKKITAYTEEELRYGKYLLDNKSEVLYEYLNKELMSCNNIRDNLLNKEQSVSVKNRIKAIDEDIAVINKALGRWKEQ